LPGAATQVGTLTIRSAESLPLNITAQNLRTISAKPLPPGRYSTTRAVYRYDPSQDSRITVQHKAEGVQRALAWVWSCDLVTRHFCDGRTVHLAEYRVEDCGASELRLTMPDSVEWLSADVDGREMPLDRESLSSTQLRLLLPRGVRFPVVRVRYVTYGDPLRSLGSVVATWPRCDQPVFRRSWVAWLPPGFYCVSNAAAPDEDSWGKRLFGTLLRSPKTTPFAPFSPTSWAAGFPTRNDLPPSVERQRAEELLDDLASQYQLLRQATNQESPITWGELLSVWQSQAGNVRAGQPQVWIDQLSLGARDISARSLVSLPGVDARRPAADDRRDVGADVLVSNGLALLLDGNRVLLTEVEDIVDGNVRASLPNLSNVFRLPDGTSSQWLGQQPTDLRWTSLESWIGQPPLPQVCWQLGATDAGGRSGDLLGPGGWTVHRLPTTSSLEHPMATHDRTSVQVFQPQVLKAAAWALLLAATGLTTWLVRRRLTLAWPLVGAAGVAALLSPWLFVPLCQFIFLGTILGSVVACLHAARSGRNIVTSPREELTTTSIVIQALAMIAILALLLGDATATRGAEPVTEADPIYQVISPIDEQNNPTGDYVFVPREFYHALRERSSGSTGSPQQWMIYGASYHAVMHWNAAEQQLSVIELSATYDLEVFQSAAMIRLPMVESQAHLLPDSALLDGRQATVTRMEEEGGLTLEIDSPGRHRVELAFRPQVFRDGDFDRLEMAIPRVADSVLRLELPAEVKTIEFPTALGTTDVEPSTGNWIVQLGPTERLAARWPADVDSGAARETLEVDQLAWLRIQPDSAQLDARLRFSSLTSPISHVEFVADSDLRLLPPPEDSPILMYESAEGPNQIINLDFEPPFQQDLQLDLSFALDKTASVGHIRLPELRSSADRTKRRWLAVSVDPSLVCSTISKGAIPAGPAPADFLAAWGEAESAPSFVVDMTQADRLTGLAVQPREVRATARQQLEIACGPDWADLVLTAEVHPVEGYRLQYEVALPTTVVGMAMLR
ncbi:MAG: hypothetical protein JJ992_28030, partial [Planctomycetes bacterium]|nr:hypothetical protein [Planctomycetota bacterium]